MSQQEQLKPNQMLVKSKDSTGNIVLTINLADDHLEVRGFGKPVHPKRAHQMAEDYFLDCEAAWDIVQKIETDTNGSYSALKNDPNFEKLKKLLDPEQQTVSGVFGKEIILQILAQKNCEGIRYVLGKDDDRNTVILIGVEQSNEAPVPNRHQIPTVKSKPIEHAKALAPFDSGNMSIHGEVHEHSLTITEARGKQVWRSISEDITTVLFGSY